MIDVFSERTLHLKGVGGFTLKKGVQKNLDVVEKAFVDANFADYVKEEEEVAESNKNPTPVKEESEGKMNKTPENKMQKTSENKASSKEPKKTESKKPSKTKDSKG